MNLWGFGGVLCVFEVKVSVYFLCCRRCPHLGVCRPVPHHCVAEVSSENLRTCFQIVNAYLYLSATEFLQVSYWHRLLKHWTALPLTSLIYYQNYAESLCRSFCDLLSDITNEGQVQVLKVRLLDTCQFDFEPFEMCEPFRSTLGCLFRMIIKCTVTLMAGLNVAFSQLKTLFVHMLFS